MTGLKALVTALAWWAALNALSTGGHSYAVVGVACMVAGALSEGVILAAAVSFGILVLDFALAPSSLAGALRTLRSGAGGLGTAGWDVIRPPVIALIAGCVAGWAAKRASALPTRIQAYPATSPRQAEGLVSMLANERPDLALRWLLARSRWPEAAALGERLGMARSAERWWREAGMPERAARVAARRSTTLLQLSEPASGAAPEPGAAPSLELENVRASRFRIDAGEDET